MCEVHAALDLRRVEWGDANPMVALKRLLPELSSHPRAKLALAQEFCTLRHLIHPGVVRVFDLHSEPFGLCFSMELLEGATVREALALKQGMGRSTIQWALNLFSALAFLHGQGVAHGDVKPGNIILGPEERLVLLDFNAAEVTARPGFACSAATRGLRETLRLPSYSLLYACPERLRGGNASPAGDIFAACCTVYEMAAGVHPFKGLSALEAMEKGMFPEKPPGLGSRHWSALRKGLSFDPVPRPSAARLAACFAGQGLFSAWADRARRTLSLNF
jgi:serine/threonine-protein kinase Stk1